MKCFLSWRRTVLLFILVTFPTAAFADPSVRITWVPANVGRGQITLTLDGYSKTVRYGEYSTAASLAAAFGGSISLDPTAPIWAKGYPDGTIAMRYRKGSGSNLSFCITPDGASGCTSVSGVQLTADIAAVQPPIKKPGQPPAAGTSLYAYSITDAGGNSGFAPNGNVSAYSDSVNGQWTATYDSLNRLSGATQQQIGGQPALAFGTNTQQSFCWGYDSFGNRTAAAVSDHAIGADCGNNGSQYAATTATYDASNRFTAVSGTPSPYVYDGAGNVLDDGYHLYLYDGVGHICAMQAKVTGAATGYRYDAEGNRVAKGTLSSFTCDPAANGFVLTNEYIQGPGGEALTELDRSGTLLHTNVYAGGALVATYDGSLNLHFQYSDWLGSRRVQTSWNGAVEETCSSGAFGDLQTCTGSGDATGPTETHFTGKERDVESGLDYFGARYYGSGIGRFMSPDWASHPEAVPYASLGMPQSLNLYAYVNNNPMSQADADGHSGGETEQAYDHNSVRDCWNAASWCAGTGREFAESTRDQGKEAAKQARLKRYEAVNVYAYYDSAMNGDAIGIISVRVRARIAQGPRTVASNKGKDQYCSVLHPDCRSVSHCAKKLTAAAPTVGLDALGTFLGAIPGAGAGLVTAQVAVGIAGAANSAYHSDVGGTFAGAIGGAQLSAVAAGAEHVGFGRLAAAIPVLGSAVSAFYFYKDATEAVDSYQACRQGIGG